MPFTDRIRAAAKSAAAAAIGLAAATAHAEEPVSQESATTAPPSATDAQNLTNSVTVLSAVDLEQRGIAGLDGIAAAVPAISLTPALNSIDTLSLYMRGEGPVAPGQITLDGAVGVYQDGFYISRLQANAFDLLDLDRAEVLAGPQGAAFGRDTTGGVINLISKAPSGALRFDQLVDFGNRNSYRVLSSLDTPSWHDLSAKVTLLASSIDGYVKNKLVTTQDEDQQDYGEEKQRGARLQLSWDGLPGVRADYFLEHIALDSTPEYDSNPAENGEKLYPGYTYYADPQGPMQSTYRPIYLPLSTSGHTAQGLTLTWNTLPYLAVQSLTGYRTMSAYEYQDYAEFYGFPNATIDVYQQHQFSQDLHFSGELLDRQLGYLAGASYFEEKGSHLNDFDLYYDGEEQLTQVSAATHSQAVYAQLHGQPSFFSRRLELTAAARYTKDSKDAERSITDDGTDVLESGALSHISYNRATPQFSLAYHWSDAVTTYAKVATAYEAGGALETAPVGDFSSDFFRPETSTTYELGLKSAFMDERLRADVAVFDSRRKDVQYALPVDILTDQVLDFQSVTVKGASFDLHATPLRDLTLSANATYLHWAIDRVDALAGTIFDPAVSAGSPYKVGENIKNLFDLPYTPKYSATVAGDYALLHLDRRDVLLHLDYVYRAEMFAEGGAGPAVPGGQFDTQPAYGLLNGRITLSQETDWSHRLKFSFWGRNILNRKYYQPAVGVGAGLTSFDTAGTAPSGYTARAGAWAEPMTYGVTIQYEY
jgi:iron complex outermembrane recepter protein